MTLLSEKLSNGRNDLLCLALKKPIGNKPSKYLVQQRSAIVVFNQTPEDLFVKHEKRLSNRVVAAQVVPLSSFKRIDWKWHVYNETSTETVKMDSTPPVLSADSKSVCFHPQCGGCFETNAVRGNTPLRLNAFTYWEISIQNEIMSGTSLMIGIGTKQASLTSMGYMNLLGSNDQSYGLNHHGQLVQSTKTIDNYCQPFDFTNNSTTTIGCLFNGFTGQLSFYSNGKCLGIAFDKIPLIKSDINSCYSNLYPMASSTVARSIFKIEMVAENFPTLREICKYKIQSARSSITMFQDNEINKLPKTLVQFLNK